MNRLPVPTDDAADIALTQLHFENGHLAARNFGQHHVVRKLDELANDELEKLLHVDSGEVGVSAGGGGGASDAVGVVAAAGSAGSVAAAAGVGAGFGAAAVFFAAFAAAFFAAASGFLVFLIKLRTVSDGCAPLLIQCSIRSSFSVLFCPVFFGS